MTLITSGYTVGSNYPLNHARILYGDLTGVVTAGGVDGNLALNDFTYQRWRSGGVDSWRVVLSPARPVDCIAIGAHNFGSTVTAVTIETAAIAGGPYTQRAALTPADDSPIFILFNSATVAELRVSINGPPNRVEMGVVKMGTALQMARPIYGGSTPIGFSRAVETRHAMSESGQWLGRKIQRQARRAQFNWSNLPAAWVRSNFQPFANVLPDRPFFIAQNPLRMPESVALCWTEAVPAAAYMGVRDLMSVQMDVTGFLE